MSRRLADVLLSRIIEIGVILTWHGFWSATGKTNSVFNFFTRMSFSLDFITETHFGMSRSETSWLSLQVGWTGGCFILLWQWVLLYLYHNVSAASQYFLFLPLYSLHLLLQVAITISSFRAAWYLLDVYYLPADEDTSQLTAMAGGLVILILLRVSSCLHAGISSDAPRSVKTPERERIF